MDALDTEPVAGANRRWPFQFHRARLSSPRQTRILNDSCTRLARSLPGTADDLSAAQVLITRQTPESHSPDTLKQAVE
jgi:hypothetical protein